MNRKKIYTLAIITLAFLLKGNNVYAAEPSCYKCTQGATVFYQWDYSIDTSFLKSNCTKTENSNCTTLDQSNITKCVYKNQNGDTITYTLNHDTKTVSNPPSISYKSNCYEYIENQFSEYESFVTYGENNNKAFCKYQTIYANVPTSYSSCSIEMGSWSSASEFTLQNSDTTDNSYSKYCLYKLSSNKDYFELSSQGMKFTGTYDQYSELMITVDLKEEKILTNNIESVLANGTHFDASFTYDKLIDNYNKCASKLYWNDSLGSSTIDTTDHESSPNGPDSSNEINWGDEVERNCRGILGDELLEFINKIFKWIRIIAPIFVIVMAGVDYASAILKDDKDALNKANSKFIKRLIIAIALFFVPLVLQWLLNIFNEVSGSFTSTCGIGK